jgi:hypothetical protein
MQRAKAKITQVSLRAAIVSSIVWLLGSLLLGSTEAMAEYDVKSALQAHDSADSDNRKVWELIFGNTYNGIRWANAVLVQRRQQQLFCEPNKGVLDGPELTEMLRRQLNANPKFGAVPFGFGILIVLQITYPCTGGSFSLLPSHSSSTSLQLAGAHRHAACHPAAPSGGSNPHTTMPKSDMSPHYWALSRQSIRRV